MYDYPHEPCLEGPIYQIITGLYVAGSPWRRPQDLTAGFGNDPPNDAVDVARRVVQLREYVG